MTMRAGVRWVVVCVGAGMLLGAGATTQPSAMNVGDVQSLYDAGKYPEALNGARKVLAARETPPEDRHVLMILQAQSHLQLKQPGDAVLVLQSAKREAVKEERPRDAAEAGAFAVLIPASPGNVFTPKGEGTHGKYNILDTGDRKQAYQAMFDEQLHHLQSLKDAAQGATSFKPVLEIAKGFPDGRDLEMAATGATKKSDQFADQLENWAKGIVSATLQGFEGRITRIQIDSNVNAMGKIRPRKSAGISDDDRAELHGIIADCQKIPETLQEFTAEFHRPWQMPQALERAKDLAQRANATLQQNQKVGNGKG